MTTTGAQTYGDTVVIGADTILSGVGLTFNGTVDGAHALTLNDSGDTTFALAVGGTTPLTSLTTNAGGKTKINGGAVTTTGAQTYGDAVVLGMDTTLAASKVTFDTTLDGTIANQQGLTVSGNARFNGAVGNIVALKYLHVSSATEHNGQTVKTGGAQNYDGAVTLLQNTTLTGADLTLAAVTGGSNNLTLNSTGKTAIGGDVTGINNFSATTGGDFISGGLVKASNSISLDVTGKIVDGNGPANNFEAPTMHLTVNGLVDHSIGVDVGTLIVDSPNVIALTGTVGSIVALGGTPLVLVNSQPMAGNQSAAIQREDRNMAPLLISRQGALSPTYFIHNYMGLRDVVALGLVDFINFGKAEVAYNINEWPEGVRLDTEMGVYETVRKKK